jgi:hypothetical protein
MKGSTMSRLLFPAAALVLAALAAPVVARGPAVASSSALADAQDILAAEAAGLVNVKFIPNDSRTAQVVVTNRSDRPLTLRLPAGFAGVPVLAQMGGMQGGGFGAGGIGGGAQNVGGGGMMGGAGSMMGGPGMRGGGGPQMGGMSGAGAPAGGGNGVKGGD